MPELKFTGKNKNSDMHVTLAKMLADEDSELLFSVMIYKGQVVASLNAKMEHVKNINNVVDGFVRFIIEKFHNG